LRNVRRSQYCTVIFRAGQASGSSSARSDGSTCDKNVTPFDDGAAQGHRAQLVQNGNRNTDESVNGHGNSCPFADFADGCSEGNSQPHADDCASFNRSAGDTHANGNSNSRHRAVVCCADRNANANTNSFANRDSCIGSDRFAHQDPDSNTDAYPNLAATWRSNTNSDTDANVSAVGRLHR
jgi:hypothetical protein